MVSGRGYVSEGETTQGSLGFLGIAMVTAVQNVDLSHQREA